MNRLAAVVKIEKERRSRGVPARHVSQNGGDTHYRVTLEMDLEGALSWTFRLPFIVVAQRNDRALSRYEFPKKGTVENRLALGVDGRELCAERRFPVRHKLPAHRIKLPLAFNER